MLLQFSRIRRKLIIFKPMDSLGQLGKIRLTGFGTTEANITSKLVIAQNPAFGNFTQKREDEEMKTMLL